MKRLIPIICLLLLILTACGTERISSLWEKDEDTGWTVSDPEEERGRDDEDEPQDEPERDDRQEDGPASDADDVPETEPTPEPKEEPAQMQEKEPKEEPEIPQIQPEENPQANPNDAPPAGTELRLSDDERYQLNIFLSNFSEQNFHTDIRWDAEANTYRYAPGAPFDARTAEPMDLIDYAWIYSKINANAAEFVSFEGNSYYGINIATLNKYTNRFFNRSVSISDVQTGEWIEGVGYSIVAVGDMVCTPAADGETYSGLSVADHLYDLGDGTMRAEFVVYEATDYGEGGITSIGGINNKDVYYITPAEAASHPDLVRHISGTALLRPYTLDSGLKTYQLITYQLYEN